jgi:hypothetical protein
MRHLEDTMTPKQLLMAVPLAFIVFGAGAVHAADRTGVIVCVNDKWEEKEIAKDQKVVDYAGRCVKVPSDAGGEKVMEDCAGKYEYMPDKSWKSAGACTSTYPGGDKTFETWEEGSHLTAYPYKITGGTGKYEGASGGGTYFYENLTDTLAAGTYQGSVVTP